jgi:hypothetical protein
LNLPAEETRSTGVWNTLQGELVVVDLSSRFVYVGRLVEERDGVLVLEDVDAHDLRDTATTRENYVRQIRLHGVNVNRRRVWVRLAEVVGLSRLEDVVAD